MITFVIILITSVCSAYCFQNKRLFNQLSFSGFLILHRKEYYRFFSHGFIHIGWDHLIFNMLTLFYFGENVELYYRKVWGFKGLIYFVFLYLSSLVISTTYSFFKQIKTPNISSVGASGAVSAVLFSFILFQPTQSIYLFLFPIGIPAYIFGLIYISISLYLAKRNKDTIGHDVHIIGAIYGFIFPIIISPELFKIFISKL